MESEIAASGKMNVARRDTIIFHTWADGTPRYELAETPVRFGQDPDTILETPVRFTGSWIFGVPETPVRFFL